MRRCARTRRSAPVADRLFVFRVWIRVYPTLNLKKARAGDGGAGEAAGLSDTDKVGRQLALDAQVRMCMVLTGLRVRV